MGGQAESVIEKEEPQKEVETVSFKKSDKKKLKKLGKDTLPQIRQSQKIRTHLNGKRVHFHVDEDGIKAEVPLAQLEMDLADLKSLKSLKKVYYDSENETVLELKVGLTKKKKIDIEASVTYCKSGNGMLKALTDICDLSKPVK